MNPTGPSGRDGARMPAWHQAVAAIALNTFREAVRDRILYVILVFALGVILVSRVLSMMTVGGEEKIVKDLGLAAISIFGLLTAAFVGVSLVFKEIERRTVYTLLANPVRRWHFVAGKFAGLVCVLSLQAVLMGLVLVSAVRIQGYGIGALPAGVWMILVELVLIGAFAVLFSCFTNPVLAAVGTFAVYVVGHTLWSLRMLQERLASEWSRWLCEGLYWVLPNLDLLDVKAEVVHGAALGTERLLWSSLYGLGYAMVVIVAASAVFERREFP